MDQQLVDRVWEYLNAGQAADVEALDALYDPEFASVRCDAGRVVTVAKDRCLAGFRALRAQGCTVGGTLDDVRLLAARVHDGHGAVVVRRVRDGAAVLHTLVWRREGGRWGTLLREFTFDEAGGTPAGGITA
ncbi:nuclear transport factor 2 family protein [Kitasatospora sp. NBC_01539]|uniref:nuclear transport factor 2 family protein n=1 Tax=Kitasatospora sp. NBC_01539 TaxID=2903577 RepID=UPI0038602467